MTGAPSLSARVGARVGRLELDVELGTGDGPLVLLGPNGSGKTSVLLLLLGVLPCARGRITVGDTVLLDREHGIDVPIEERALGYVPQHYALFPHLSVRDNVAFAVQSRRARDGGEGANAADDVDAALHDLELEALADRRTHTLSGGERQRVALARALAAKPRALLLDEPLAALDVASRRQVRAFLAQTLARLALPSVVVTHDPADARALGGRIAVLENGRVTQAGRWAELEAHPATAFVEALVQSASS